MRRFGRSRAAFSSLCTFVVFIACGDSSSDAVEASAAAKPVTQAEASADHSAFAPTSTPTCTDGVKNGPETDIDCGGSCQPCADGKACAAAADCATQQCSGGTCCLTKEYAKESGPTQGQGELCCEAGDDLVTYSDCGSGSDHVVMPAGNCAFMVADDGVACAKITCRSSTCAKSCQGVGYQRSTGPVGGQVCCEDGDTLVKVIDCGNGNNHSVSTAGQCGIGVEGSGNYGSACAQILCSTQPCPSNPDAGTVPTPK
jgi:hypothetical protein